jgi:hypothetical protein
LAEADHIPLVHFKKGQNKEEVARPYLEVAAQQWQGWRDSDRVAQQKASVGRSWPRKGQQKARHPHLDWAREMPYQSLRFYLSEGPFANLGR